MIATGPAENPREEPAHAGLLPIVDRRPLVPVCLEIHDAWGITRTFADSSWSFVRFVASLAAGRPPGWEIHLGVP